MMRTLLPLFLASTLLTMPVAVSATTVLDAAGDFAPGYTAAAADLDVRSFTVTYNAATQVFSLTGVMNAAINPATDGFYIIGVNTGMGLNAPFTLQGAPNVRFDQAIRVNKNGSVSVGPVTGLTATISGTSFTVDLLASLFPTTGLTTERYGFNLWPRGPNTPGSTTTFVTDFAPNDSTIAAVPESASWAMMLAGLALAGSAMRRRTGTGAGHPA